MKTINIFFILFVIIFLFSACHKRQELDFFSDYESYDRTVGIEGKDMVFLRNYADDSDKTDTLLKFSVPPEALDETIIVNFYEYDNNALNLEIQNKFSLYTTSKFFYVLPFYEYTNNPDNDSLSDYRLDNHLSIDFYDYVTCTYFIDTTFYSWLEPTDRLYRIRTPRYNQWPENIWTKYSEQGYPTGFYETDLFYLINGKWNEYDDYSEGDYSMINWEEVPYYNINPANHSVSFLMENTDYIYVICYDVSKNQNRKK